MIAQAGLGGVLRFGGMMSTSRESARVWDLELGGEFFVIQ